MSKITYPDGEVATAPVPPIVGVSPVGTQVLVELLTAKELAGPSRLHVPDGAHKDISGAPQAYVLKVGPMVDERFGIHQGARVVLSGSFTPLPELSGNTRRPLACIEPHTIKAVLSE